ncbi:hypothetical protein ACIPYQ_12960 [Streptomyces sp. NPDC090045]|uniref:hypothetical protein n=1 Tax=Streptomyces sp. NPDC090045 TaxID=3365927 RepID=UPI00380F5377
MPAAGWACAARTAAGYGGPPLAVHRPALADAPAGAPPRRLGPVRRHGRPGGRPGRLPRGPHLDRRPRRRRPGAGLRYSRETVWRTVLPAAASRAEADTAETWGRGERFGVVPLADGRIYLYAAAVVPRATTPPTSAPSSCPATTPGTT